jgi:diacylglycerol kinase (ATP)
MKKVRFIINPISGAGKNKFLVPLIEREIDRKKFQFEISLTEYAGHGTLLAKDAAEKNYDAVVAVGGDGSVNEIAKSLVHTNTALGIVPTGSGNGMSRHLSIPMNSVKAIRNIYTGVIDTIDTIMVNEHFCIGTIGASFDAHIAHLFAKAPKRGYSTYVKLVLTEFASYPAKVFTIVADGKQYEEECFLLTFSNSSQFGNNFVIAPFADVKDGLMEISIMRRFPALAAPKIIYQMVNNKLNKSKYYHGFRGKHVVLKNQGKLEGHIDGEPVVFDSDLDIKIVPASLRIIVPGSKKPVLSEVEA